MHGVSSLFLAAMLAAVGPVLTAAPRERQPYGTIRRFSWNIPAVADRGLSFVSMGCRLLGGFYKGAGKTPRPTAVLIHGLPGIEKHLDIAYRLRDLGWNCLYFHFRVCWGSEGAYSLAGLTDDTRAAVEWVVEHRSVDRDRIALIAGSTGSYPALLHGATDTPVRAIVGISPVIEPGAFQCPSDMAREFAGMVQGVTGEGLVKQWAEMASLLDSVRAFAPRPVLLVAAQKDDIFPPSQYADSLAGFPHVQLIRNPESDHGFSACRPWLVQTVTDWLVAKLGR